MSKRITPFASQNMVAITLAADLCTLNFLVTGEDGCFQVMESQTLHSNDCSATSESGGAGPTLQSEGERPQCQASHQDARQQHDHHQP
ncbi:hypothetical protein PoB_004714400 [Plakobranchus ocellatus]|uniref:Uncharacterized protein n=1 Tax=Plakobranchus ocellatus TaxID=259542 RepID=A0AAV4BQN1_9GAST|nr:hypothetical protein PoB_004714400 [Plakobranchus ocellatus]